MEDFRSEKMTRTTFWCIAIIVILALVLMYSFIRFITVNNELQQLQQKEINVETNTTILNFTHLLIDRVLKNDSEVSFEDRLELENAVRATEDTEVLAAWKSFVESESSREAQVNIVELLDILMDKVQE